MKIELNCIPRSTLAAFADQHGLTMKVTERRDPAPGLSKFYAGFEGVEIMDRCFLVSSAGNGDTPEEAIRDYMQIHSRKRLVHKAMSEDRREFDAPEFTGIE